MPRQKQTELMKIEADSFDSHLKKKGLGLPLKGKIFSEIAVPIFTRKSASEVHDEKVTSSGLSSLPDDVNVIIWKYQGMWQVVLNCSVLNVSLGCSDREPVFQNAVKQALEQYAKNKLSSH